MSELLTLKQKRFIAKVIKMPQGQAYRQVYECQKNSADTSASRLLSKDKIRDRAEALLQETTDDDMRELVHSLKSMTIAQKMIILKDKLVEVKDNPTRLEAIKTLCKIYGLYNTSDNSSLGSYHDNRSINISLNSNDVSKLDDICKRLERMKTRTDFVSGEIEIGEGVGGG